MDSAEEGRFHAVHSIAPQPIENHAMPEPASIDQEILQQIDAALRKFEQPPPEPEPEPECPSENRGIRWLLTLFACLTVIYHADHTMAQVIEGETTDDHVFVSWEYDLESGMGQVMIRNIDAVEGDYSTLLYLTGLVPERIEDLTYRWPLVADPCPESGAPPDTVFGRFRRGEQAGIEFAFCDAQTNSGISLPPCSLIRPATQEVEYGGLHQWSAACFFFPGGSLQDFVTVRPLECGESDRDDDNDVDLQDFADFQANTPPEQLPCIRVLYDELTGPQ